MATTPHAVVDGLPQPGRCLVMGILNVTPDSFSDGGAWLTSDAAIRHGMTLHRQGADLVDVGGESTRPGAMRPSVDEEIERVLPVVESLVDSRVLVTIDTMRAEVAHCAIEAGAVAVNDVSGGLADDAMLSTVVRLGVPYFAMHWRGHSTTMQDRVAYTDVVADVVDELSQRVQAALAAGIEPGRLAIDPGIGFAKLADHNWALLAALDRLHSLGQPVLLGASRKAFLGALLADGRDNPRPASERDSATAAVSALAAAQGAWCVRVHDVGRSLDAVRVATRWSEEPTR
ncbi:MAG: dihydropteroate synthase [Nocardioidaceae bacterium]